VRQRHVCVGVAVKWFSLFRATSKRFTTWPALDQRDTTAALAAFSEKGFKIEQKST
jgi:hypothetical protein